MMLYRGYKIMNDNTYVPACKVGFKVTSLAADGLTSADLITGKIDNMEEARRIIDNMLAEMPYAGKAHELVAMINQRKSGLAQLDKDIAYALRFKNGRGASDDECSKHFVGVELEKSMLALGDLLRDEATIIDGDPKMEAAMSTLYKTVVVNKKGETAVAVVDSLQKASAIFDAAVAGDYLYVAMLAIATNDAEWAIVDERFANAGKYCGSE